MKRNFGLDLIRAVSIWMVLVMHLGWEVSWLKPNQLGGYGVEVFFVLSGFLIGQILLKSLYKANNPAAIWQFWVRRWFRILPLYYLAILFKYFVIGPEIGGNIFYYLIFVQNHFYGIDFYPVTWSLVIEEWFYLFSPIFLSVVLFVFKNRKKPLLLSVIGFIVLVNVLRALYVFTTGADFYAINGNVPLRFDSLFWGVLLALLKLDFSSFYERLAQGKVFLMGLLLLAALLSFNAIAYDPLWGNGAMKLIQMTAGISLFSAFIAFIVPYAEQADYAFLDGNWRTVRQFITLTSLLTYGIYLIHPLVFKYVRSPEFIEGPAIVRDLLATGLTFLAAYLVYVLFERPILKVRDRLTKVKRSDALYNAR